jgi:hypothetical protein
MRLKLIKELFYGIAYKVDPMASNNTTKQAP